MTFRWRPEFKWSWWKNNKKPWDEPSWKINNNKVIYHICHLLLQLTKPLLKLHGGNRQGDIRCQAGCGLVVRQVFLGAWHGGGQVGGTVAMAGSVRLAVPVLEVESGSFYRMRMRGRRQRRIWGWWSQGRGWGCLWHAGLVDLDWRRLVWGHLLLQGQDLDKDMKMFSWLTIENKKLKLM